MLGLILPARQWKATGRGRVDASVTGRDYADGRREDVYQRAHKDGLRASFADRVKISLEEKATQAMEWLAKQLHEGIKSQDGECGKSIAPKVEIAVDTRPAQSFIQDDKSLLPIALAQVVEHLSAEVQRLQQTRQSLEGSVEGLREQVGSLTEQRDRAEAQAQALLSEREEEDLYACAAAMFIEGETCTAAAAAPYTQRLPAVSAVPVTAFATQSVAVSAVPDPAFATQSVPLDAFFPEPMPASPAPVQHETSTATPTEEQMITVPPATSDLPAAPSGLTDAAPSVFISALLPLPNSSQASHPAATAASATAVPEAAPPLPFASFRALFPTLAQETSAGSTALPSGASPASFIQPDTRPASTLALPVDAALPHPCFAHFGKMFLTPTETAPPSAATPSDAPTSSPTGRADLLASTRPTEPVDTPLLDASAPMPNFAALFPGPAAQPSSPEHEASAPPPFAALFPAPAAQPSSPEQEASAPHFPDMSPAPATEPSSPKQEAHPPSPFAALFPAPAVQPSSPKQDAYAAPPFADMFPTPATEPSSPEQDAYEPHPFADMFSSPAAQPSSSEEEGSEATTSGYHPQSPPASAADNYPEPWRQYEDLLNDCVGEEEEEHQPVARERPGGSAAEVAQLRREVKDLRWDKTRLQGQLRAAVPIPSVEPSTVTISMKRQRTAEGTVEVVPRKLGRGGFGVVYHAYHEQFGFVAYKELKARSDDEDEDFGLSRLEPEAEVMACVPRHRNVMPLLARVVDVMGNLQGLLMPLCEGGSARRLLRLETPEAAILAAAEDGARGLAYLHDQDVVHCDVKLDNLLLQAGPAGTGPALLADFGTAGCIDEATRKARMSGCTRHLCSPELHSMLEECEAAKEAACEAGEPELSVPAPQIGREEDTWQYGLAVLALATRDANIARGSGPRGRLTDAELEAALERADAACPLLAEAARMCLERDGGARAPMQVVAAHLAAARTRDAELAAACEETDAGIPFESCTDDSSSSGSASR